MKKTISRAVTALIVALTVSFAMTGCGPEEPGGNGNESIAVTGVSLNHNTLNIDEGDSASLIVRSRRSVWDPLR